MSSLLVEEVRERRTGWTPQRDVAWMTLVVWIGYYAGPTLANILDRTEHALNLSLMRLMVAASGIGLCYLIHLALGAVQTRPLKVRIPLLVGLGLVAAEIFAWGNLFALNYARGEPTTFAVGDPGRALLSVFQATWFFLAWGGLYFALESSAEAKERERAAARLQHIAQESKLQALYSQVNPHFLFNSLNAVSALILDGRVAEADRMIQLLGSFLRRTLAIDPLLTVTLSEELALQRDYLLIEQVRFPDLSIEVDTPQTLAMARLPALTLQPLVENAVKHGVARSPPPGFVRITADASGQMLRIVIENNSAAGPDGGEAPGAGLGLRNLRDRLVQHFQQTFSLDYGPGAAGSFRAVVCLPLRFE